MRINSSTLTTFSIGALGAVMGVAATTHYLNRDRGSSETVVPTAYPSVGIPVVNSAIQSDEAPQKTDCETYPNLTLAASKTVESVVHIQTHFVVEESTYDPFLRLFYGDEAYRKRRRHGEAAGSGVVISPKGYIVTNNHVVQDASKVSVVLGQKKYDGQIIGTDPSTDLAVVKIDAAGLKFSEFGNSDKLQLGEWVLAVGNPLNLQSTVTAGIVSAKNRNIDLLTSNYDPEENIFPIESFIQTDAAVNSGNSGGALVNQKGELVGVNTAIASGTGYYAGYSFAVPSNIVKKVTYDLIKYGEVKRVLLGINISDNNSEIQRLNNLSTDKGIVITKIIAGGNADKSDMKVKDVILSVGGEEVHSVSELQGKIALYNPGDQIKIGVMRGDTQKDIEIVME